MRLVRSRSLCHRDVMTWRVEHISRSITAAPAAVCAVVGDLEQLPRWAAGLSSGVRLEEGRWVTESPMGLVEVRFTGNIAAGILDHDVVLPDGTVVHNPLRVLPNDGGSEVVFSLFERAGMTDDDFEGDAKAVRADLNRLAAIFDR